MAEAILRQLAGHWFDVDSAGFEPRPVQAAAIGAMSLAGIDISGAKSKSVFDLYRSGRTFDYVIRVCDAATAERCPTFPGICERLHWDFPDPASFTGTDDDKLAETVKVREQIRARIVEWLAELERRGGPAPRLMQGRSS
jgi:arsenate reductase (thioredoxin)